jgi:hypothetical protein
MRASYSIIAVAASLACGAVNAGPSRPFNLLALKSGTSLQFAPIAANNLNLVTNAPTTADSPPPGVDASGYENGTLFNLEPDGSVTMAIGTTGIQYLYWSPQTDIARITPGHSDYIPDGGVSSFNITGSGSDYQLNFEYGPAYACGTGPNYTIFFEGAALNTANCQEIGLLVQFSDSYDIGAYQYI